MRALITGASGFAGAWLCRECAAAGDEVVALSRRGAAPDGSRGVAVDLRDGDSVRAAIRETRPDVVYHLAALTSVGRSWSQPAQTVADNDLIAVGLLEALRTEAPDARVLWVSSCEVYGEPEALPTPENARLAPANPYAVSKLAGELLTEVYRAAYELRIVRARPFSHSGPGQLSIFLLSSLARQAAEGRLAEATQLRIVVGNPDTRRDFTDVRDIVRGYRMLAGSDAAAGEAFNVSTGVSVSAGEQVDLLAELLAPIAVERVIDPTRVRAREVMELRGDPTRLKSLTGWEPRIPLSQTMADTVAWWERELAREPP
ncbi:MAG: GDP-mannose 4,6-dehydratase [Solirubrobacteraceae bacterium]